MSDVKTCGPQLAPPPVLELCAEAALRQQQGKIDEAIRLLRRALALKPDFAAALNNLGCAWLAKGQLKKAATIFSQLLLVMPELFEGYGDLVAILMQVFPFINTAMARANAVWPQRLPAREFFDTKAMTALADDSMLRCMLKAAPVRDIRIERLLTSARMAILDRTVEPSLARPSEKILEFCCALAMQCFINEYVFTTTEEERDTVSWLKTALVDQIAAGGPISPLSLIAVAAYEPLHALPHAGELLRRRWPSMIEELVTQQVREPHEEKRLQSEIPRLTTVENPVSLDVQRQYEANPYPRWVLAPSRRPRADVNAYVREQFPGAPFHDLNASGTIEMLIAGCGTGFESIGMARLFRDTNVLAVDLSRASLSYAARKSRELGVRNIAYAQADILNLGSIGRSFDIVVSSGVLHHLSDPFAGWRILLGMLRPGGLMHVGLYSEIGRRDILAARAFIAARGYKPTADDIRRCRQELTATPLESLTRVHDFYSTSECRDLLFHVQEHRMAIPQIKSFLTENSLTFLGFKVPPGVQARYRARFPDDPAMTSLDRWHAFEQEHPSTFSAMYQAWLQKD